MTTPKASALVGVIMGSESDWDRCMKYTAETLTEFGLPHECRVVSAHRTPDWMTEYAGGAAKRGLEAIIAGAGGRGTSAGHGRRSYVTAGHRRSGAKPGAERYGLAPVDRADAGGCACRHNGNRESGRHQRRAVRHLNPERIASIVAQPAATVSPKPRRASSFDPARVWRVVPWRMHSCIRSPRVPP